MGDYDMPGHGYGLASRAHRVRPSEKTALRVVPGFSPLGHPRRPSLPRRGGLRTPVGETSLLPGDRPIRPPGVPLPPMIMLCLALRPALPRGRAERVRPRKSPFASSPGLPRKAIPARLGLPPEGRALHAPSETSPPNALLKEPPECLFPNHTRTNCEPTMKAFFGIDQLPKCGIGRLAH
jgi:hypothetical protein